MKVSVVIPCYKQAHFLKDAVESVKNQTYKNVEIIVVNDGSPDNTTEVANRLGVRCIEKKNGGLSSARNAGIKAAKGELILPLDADDKIDPLFLEKTVPHTKEYDIVSTSLRTFGNENRTWGSNWEYPNLSQMRRHNQINCCSLFSKKLWYNIGGYDENMKDGFEDWDFWLTALERGARIKVIPEHLFYYRKHGVSMLRDAMKKRTQILEYMRLKRTYATELIDVVIPFGNGSKSANNELRFCLRSIERFLHGYRNIYIVGAIPRWVKNVIHIPHTEGYPKAYNIYQKIRKACEQEGLSEKFIMFNDDYFLIEQVEAWYYPNYYSNKALDYVRTKSGVNPYRMLTEDTVKLFGKDFKYADIHCPIVMEKSKFLQLDQLYEPKKYTEGLLVKSMYLNTFAKTRILERSDPILRGPKTREELEAMELTTEMLSIHDEAINQDFISYIEEKFPDKCSFEV
jgi:glycosyltransferase involved in cell wall biosynthesis